MKRTGYPLPAGELGEDEIVCQLVYLPDRPEYWQAFLGALHYMTTWRAWEKDADKRGQDAAANWRDAFELTIGCWRMTCLEDLQNDVAEILEVLKLPRDCCDESDVTGGDQYTDRVDDGVGDVPQNIIDAGYATGVGDWDGFDDYKCMIVHVLVDQIEVRLASMLPWVDFAGKTIITIGILTAIATVILATGGAVLAVGVVATTGVVAGLYAAILQLVSLEDLIDNVSDNHDELACSMYWADGDVAALEALNDKIDFLFTAAEALVLKNMNLGPTLKALYAGRYDQQDIAETLEEAGYDVGDFDCECDIQVGEFLYVADFEDGHEGFTDWNVVWGDGWGHGDNGKAFYITYNSGGWARHSHNTLRFELDAHVGVSGDRLEIHSIAFWYRCEGDASTLKPALTVIHDDDTHESNYPNSYQAWARAKEVFSPPLVITMDGTRKIDLHTTGGVTGFVKFDDVEIDCDAFDV